MLLYAVVGVVGDGRLLRVYYVLYVVYTYVYGIELK